MDLPDASRCLYQRLVAVIVELGIEFLAQRRRVAEVGDLRILVEVVCYIRAVGAEVERRHAVAYVVVLVGVLNLCALCVLCGGNKLSTLVVSIYVSAVLRHRRARTGNLNTPPRCVVNVVVL